MKYSFVPQTEAPYKMDRYSPVDWSASEPEKVRRRIKEVNKEPSTNSSAYLPTGYQTGQDSCKVYTSLPLSTVTY